MAIGQCLHLFYIFKENDMNLQNIRVVLLHMQGINLYLPLLVPNREEHCNGFTEYSWSKA